MLQALSAAFGAFIFNAGFGSLPPAAPVPGEWLVGLSDPLSLRQLLPVISTVGSQTEELEGLDILRVKFAPGTSMVWAARALRSLPSVRFVEPNYQASVQFVPNDPAFSNQFNIKLVMAPQSWDFQRGNASVSIAILDSGVDMDHPELSSKLMPGYDFVHNDSIPEDDFGHGTMCAGVAAAQTNNAIGLAGAAPGCSLMPIKVLNEKGTGTYANIASGIRWAADHGAQVISMSFAGTASSNTLDSAVQYAWNKGVILVAAAGNQGQSRKMYPAAIPKVIAVGSVNKSGYRSDFTNWGSWVDVAAPGELVYSTYLDNGYASSKGTSFSAPLVAAEAALLISKYGNLMSPGQVRFLIEHTCTPVGNWLTYGLVNFYRSLSLN